MAAPRMMAMVARQPTSTALVTPNWSAEARLPYTIRLPIQIANAVHGVGSGRREIVIRRDGALVPALIIQWMQGDPHYRTWFLQEVTPAKELTRPDPEAEPVESIIATMDVEPEADDPADRDKPIRRGRRKKSADGDKDDA